jgi:methionyl aminopeptidase
MIIIKNKRAIESMRKAGHALSEILASDELKKIVQPGISTDKIDQWVEGAMRKAGLYPECIGYGGYKHATCISVNDAVVHGVPSKKYILQEGDLVKIDVVGSIKGYCADMARCFIVGKGSVQTEKIVEVAQKSLDAALERVAPGVALKTVVQAIQSVVEEAGFGIVREFAGHGIGKSMHEAPDVPNYVDGVDHLILQEGMTLAIEPMITEGSHEVFVLKDGWTAKTVDGKLAAHVEDTVLVTATGCEVLTRL